MSAVMPRSSGDTLGRMPPKIFEPLTLRGLTVAGRVWVSPMCQYSCRSSEPGFVTDWHLAHLMSFAVGGAPLVMTEATAGTHDGRSRRIF